MSAIGGIYLAVANMQLGGVKSRNLPDVKLEVAQADLPLRLLLPNTKGDMNFVMIGNLQKIEWAIRDLCLWAPVGAGGIKDYAEPMLNYIKSYLSALKQIPGPTNQSHITGFAFEMGVRPWGDNDYWSIDVLLSVEEIL